MYDCANYKYLNAVNRRAQAFFIFQEERLLPIDLQTVQLSEAHSHQENELESTEKDRVTKYTDGATQTSLISLPVGKQGV